MIRGHKPGSYYVTADANGKKIEGEGRICCHCQFCWEYRPGSGIRRGYCLRHDGWLCGRPTCTMQQASMRAQVHWPYPCISFDDYNDALRAQYDRDPKYVVLTSGIVVPVAWLQAQE
jgi:hypothetical protein